MNRDVHDIYDAILKIIISVYQSLFLNYIGVDEEIKEILNIEFTKMNGHKIYLDFLCLFKSNSLGHIEFQYPYAKSNDEYRFFDYNITAEVRYGKHVDTYVFNFTSKREHKPIMIGETKLFSPIHFYLGDIDFNQYFENINIKVKSKKHLSYDEEITLMLMPISLEFEGDVEILNRISEILQFEELFSKSKFQFIEAVIKLEIISFLTEDEQNQIGGELKMTPQAERLVTRAINEVNWKVLAETQDKARLKAIKEGREEGLEQGREEGLEQGREEGMEKILRSLRDDVDLEILSQKSGLTIEEIKKL